jgi:hypothetical protein
MARAVAGPSIACEVETTGGVEVVRLNLLDGDEMLLWLHGFIS